MQTMYGQWNQVITVLKAAFDSLKDPDKNSLYSKDYLKQHTVMLLKIVSDLNLCGCWDFLIELGYGANEKVVLDYVWSAQRFTKTEVCSQTKSKAAAKTKRIKTSAAKMVEA